MESIHIGSGSIRGIDLLHEFQILREWFQADGFAAYVDLVGVFDGVGGGFAVLEDDLGAVELLFASADEDSIGEIRGVSRVDFVFGEGFHLVEAFLLENSIGIGVLNQDPGVFGALSADQRLTRPAVLGNDVFEPDPILSVRIFQTLLEGVESGRDLGIEIDRFLGQFVFGTKLDRFLTQTLFVFDSRSQLFR